VGGDTAKYALDNKLVDELATSTEVEKATLVRRRLHVVVVIANRPIIVIRFAPAKLFGQRFLGIIDGLRKVGGDTAKYALDNKLVDELATSTEVERSPR
jgi:ClpP class serine protease